MKITRVWVLLMRTDDSNFGEPLGIFATDAAGRANTGGPWEPDQHRVGWIQRRANGWLYLKPMAVQD